MIRRLFASYVDAIAADRGVLAFFKWFVVSAALHVAAMVPPVLSVFAAQYLPGTAGKLLVVLLFLAGLLTARLGICALAAARAAERKGLGSMLIWGIGGFLLGPLVVGLVGALPPKGEARPS